ncbi:nuclear pore complex protein DDB_G0274915-like [Ceratina calcarata]|uniref:Nuclear pore complex protein DDB_G0274915-like n=1 Tax=Ceratina calcarata TaxID=156304 RepID=A0AAJ7N4I0_9HYME|nr:nuclear pore complex protein DDB_G0274915-like [Ceratina calcarata]
MWELGNRSVVALVSALCVCVIVYTVSVPIFVLTVSLVLTIYACYFLIINDSLLSQHALVLYDYCKQVSSSVHAGIATVAGHTRQHVHRFTEAAKRGFRRLHLTQIQPGMERRRGSHYQLSSEFYSTGRNSDDFARSISQFSPIRRNSQSAHTPNDITPRNKLSHEPTGRVLYDHTSFATKHSSTPMFSSSKEELENQTINLLPTNRSLTRRTSGHNNVYYKEESPTYFTNNDSLWGTTVSPKQGIKGIERKTVQTVAGPLLATTRYNIDPKVYNDVHSPGLTTRLTKYAMEANSKLTHQPQYRLGQFPKVNLNASPVPLINPKSVKTRTPMTVRVAPPNSIRYSPPSKQNNLSNLCHLDNSSLPSSVAHLRDISLKRHASRDDVAELTKKQRTDGLIRKEVEPQDEMKQKRSRDDSMRSEEDSSPQSSARPTKRTKTPSCYDIINSLSSSKHVVSGVKRKARDFSRSGTPDFEKHFKSLEQSPDIQTLSQLPHTSPMRPKIPNQEKESNVADKKSKHSPLKGILKSSNAIPENTVSTKRSNIQKDEKDRPSEQPAAIESSRLTHKLFMRAEPERNEKLRMLVEEQGNVRAKFTTDDVEEIKREDIADMRQTSMKARLQSMFDAISGKAATRIDPDVVIQAEDVNAVEADQPVSNPVSCATLNSSTTTTNINTTPISTSVIAVNPGASESIVKHVAFNLPTKETPNTNSVQFAETVQRKDETVPTSLINKTTNVTSGVVFTTTESKTENVSKPVTRITNTISSASVPNFEFGKPIPAKSTTDTLPTSINNTNTPLLAPSTTASIFKNVIPAATPTFSTTLVSTPVANVRNEGIQSNMKMNVSQSEGIVSTSLNAPIGNSTMIATPTQSNPVKPSVIPLATAGKEENTNSPFTTGIASTASSSVSSSVSSIATTTINSSTSLFTFGNKSNSPSTFVFGTSIGNAPQTSGTFGNPIFQASIVPTISNATTTTSATNSLQSNPVATTATFESSAKTTVGTTANSTFSFRPASTTSASDNKIGFSFGNAATTNANAKTGVSNAGLFTMGNNNSIPCFGAPSTTSAPVQYASNPGSIFANTSSPATPIFGTATTTNQSIFNAPSSLSSTTSAFVVPKITTPVFGSSAATTTAGFASTSSMPVFSNPNNETSSTVISTASVPVFGSNASTSASTSGATNLFSAPASAPSTTATNIFGQSSSTMTNFKSTTGVFGNNTGSSVFGSLATTTATFGTSTVASNPVITTSASTSAFGSTSIPASTASIPNFGATSTVASGFRSQNQNKPGPSSASQNFGGSIFGSENTSAHIFGTSNGTASPFSSASTSNATNPTFGAASTSGSTAFGDANKVPSFGGQPSAFGASTSTPAPSVFGNTSNATGENNNASSGIFSFGANQKPAQPSTTFSFGSNNTSNNATASTSAPFQFGTPNTGAGFNFSAPSTTPSINFGASSSTGTFNASAPGMFSIGSGSTAPRSRSTRSRKLR